MKKAIWIIFSIFILTGCGSTDIQAPETSSSGDQGQVTDTLDPPPEQPFIFEEVGKYIHGNMLIDIESLPSGNWIVASRDGHVIVLNPEFKTIGHSSIPTNTYWDAGLFEVELLAGKLYASLTMADELCPDTSVFCNGIVRYDFDETSDDPLSNIEVVFTQSMLDRRGQHNGGGMVVSAEGKLILGIGDGQIADEGEPFIPSKAQDDSVNYGKILEIDSNGIESPVVLAKGVRNPFTAFAIPGLGMMFGDVGFETYEELNLLRFDESGINFGWPLEEGPKEGSAFTQPIGGFDHCDSTYQDEDPFSHTKSHAGVVHTCGFAIITAAGFYDGQGTDPYGDALDRTVIFSQAYEGYIRGLSLDEDGTPSNNRHLAHFPGLTSVATGPDGFLYGVSIFGSNHVLKMVKNHPEDAPVHP